MPRSTKQNAAMRQATRTAVLQSAITLFAQNGYAHTSTRQIAKEANISAGLMYHYFNSKEMLLRAVFHHCIDIISHAFTKATLQAQPPHRLRAVLTAIFGLLASDPPFWTLFYALRSQPTIMRLLGDEFRLSTMRMRIYFESELAAAGRSQPRLDALLLYSVVEGTIQQYLLYPSTYPLEAMVQHIIDQFDL